MPGFMVENVRLDKLLNLRPGEVIDVVPPSRRSEYRYWRGLHLGKLALNLMKGRYVINAGSDDVIHFIDDHGIAYGYAASEAQPRHKNSPLTQWNDSDTRLFQQMTGRTAPTYFGGMVVAYAYNGVMPRAVQGMGHGYAMNSMVGFGSIDDYSRSAIGELFEVNLATLQ